MSNLDVALRLRLINGIKPGAQEAKRDLDALRGAAQQLNSVKTDGLTNGLTRVVTTGSRADASLRRLAANSSGLSATGTAVGRLGNDLSSVASAGSRADASLRTLGASRARIAGTAAVAAELARNLERAAAAAPRVRVPPSAGAGPTGERPSGRLPPRPPRAARPQDERREPDGAAGSAGEGAMVALGRRAIPAIGGIYATRAALKGTIGQAIGFEKAWSEVIKKVNDAPSPEAMLKLQRTIVQTSIDLGIPRQGLAELTAEAGAAGIKFGDLERYVKLAAKASVGWDMTPRDASQKLAEIKTAGSYTIAEMDVLADKINALGDNSAAKESDIVEMMQRAAAPAKAAGVDADTSLASLTALRSSGMQAEIAARFFGAFTSKLATAEKDGKKGKGIQEAFEEIGLTVEKVTAGMKRDAGGTMIDILDRLAKHAEPAKVAKKLMGAEWWDELARFSQAAPELRKQLDFLKNPANFSGSLGNNLNVQLSTTANHLERLKSLAGDVGERMGRWALPGINSAIESIVKQTDEVSRRKALADAGKEPEGDQTGRFVTATSEVAKAGFVWAKDKLLDATIGQLPTQDPAREAATRSLRAAADASEAAVKAREDARLLEGRAAGADNDDARESLRAQARRALEQAEVKEAESREATRNAGPAAARDMTGVEFGELAARQSVETRRRMKLLESGLAIPGANVRLPGTPIVTSRSSVEEELAELRKKMESLGASPSPAPAATPSEAPRKDLTKSQLELGPLKDSLRDAGQEAERLKTTLGQDLSAPATQSMQTYTGALKAGMAEALAAAVAAAASIKAALSFSAAPTISPGAAPSAGGASPARATSAPASRAPRLQSAGLGRGGVNINGPVHVHGVNDVASLHRGISREADRRARDARDGALHDLGSYA